MKKKLFVFINITGLGVSLACGIVAYLSWDYNQKYDVQHVNAEEIYRVNFVRITNGFPRKNGSCPQPLGKTIEGSISGIDEVVRYFPTGGNFRIKDDLFRIGVSAVDDNFLDVFTFPLISGNKAALKEKGKIIISSEIKDKYFPDHFISPLSGFYRLCPGAGDFFSRVSCGRLYY